MRIAKLTTRSAKKLFAERRRRDPGAERIARRIVADVRRDGDIALFRWARTLDGVSITSKSLWISPREFRAARGHVEKGFLRAMEHAARNIRRVAEQQTPRPWQIEVEAGVRVGQRVMPIERIGCYIPGGRFSLVSTLLMTVIPAQVAGVRKISVTCPRANTALLATAGFLGLRRIARIGGAQAVAAMAYGTESFPRVDKIFGPGNRYVTAAKLAVSADCAIDLPAGPTEVLVLATGGNPRFIAADLLAQAEHDPEAIAVVVTTSGALARAIQLEVSAQLRRLPRENPARRSLAHSGAILVAPSVNLAVAFVNEFAPEHLSMPREGATVLDRIAAAGSVFLGPWSAQSIGDYASGTNHVLPTSGWARSRGGLSTADFVRCASVQRISRRGLERLAPVVESLAAAEGLTAHGRAVEVRR